MEQSGQITRLKYRPQSYNGTAWGINLYHKWYIYSKKYNIPEKSNFYKSISAIRTIRNSKVAHRGAYDVTDLATPPIPITAKLSVDKMAELLIQQQNTEQIRDFLIFFVKHIRNNIPK